LIASLTQASTHSYSSPRRSSPVNEQLLDQLAQAQKRENLSILIGEPKALPPEIFNDSALERFRWEGFAALLPCHEPFTKCGEDAALKSALPIISALAARPDTPAELQKALDEALHRMRKAVTQPKIDGREKADPPPPGLSGSGDARV
jgi:hypothetical protein